jgi:hypothetical protein
VSGDSLTRDWKSREKKKPSREERAFRGRCWS